MNSSYGGDSTGLLEDKFKDKFKDKLMVKKEERR